MNEQIADLGHVKLAYAVMGSGKHPAIMLIRGLGTQMIDWPDNFIEALLELELRVVVFDNRDAGHSDKFTGTPDIGAVARGEQVPEYTLQDMAGDVVHLMDFLGIERAHLLGISMGGMIGQVVAADHKERLLSFISVMSSSSRPGLPGPTQEAATALQRETPADATADEIIAAAVEDEKIWASPAYPVAEEEIHAAMRRRYERSYCPEGVGRQMAAVVATGDRSALLKAIRVPTLVIHGEADTLIPLAAGEDTARQIPGARFVALPGMGHNLPPTLIPELMRHISAFLQG